MERADRFDFGTETIKVKEPDADLRRVIERHLWNATTNELPRPGSLSTQPFIICPSGASRCGIKTALGFLLAARNDLFELAAHSGSAIRP